MSELEQQPGGWMEFQLAGPLPALELFADFMDELGAGGAVFSEEPRTGGQMVTVFLPGPTAGPATLDRVRARVAELRGDFPGGYGELALTRVEDRDWNEEYEKSLEPIRLEPGLWIVPTFKEPPPEAAGEPMLRLDPGLAFGTGLHETTAACLALMGRLVREGARSVLDLGTGTGILAMAAARLGAERVLGLDLDTLALRVAESNLRLNGLEGRVRLGAGVSDPAIVLPEPPFDLIAANVFAEALCRLMPFIARHLAPNGRAALSGILADRLPLMERALAANRLRAYETIKEGKWVTLLVGPAAN
jgi:ribosomal protein L11 methyltransferase